MDMNEQVLQKLLEMAEAQKQRDAEQKQRDADLAAQMTALEAEVKEIRKEQVVQSVNQAKLEGNLNTAEAKRDSNLARLEMKVDNFLSNLREKKTDTSERWKVGSIIASCSIAIALVILAILTRLNGN